MIKYLVMDIDGTLTDGKIYMGPSGEIMKAFSVKDGYVFNYILKPRNITPIVVTARTSTIVEQRCKELGITEIYQGHHDKLALLKEIIGEENLQFCAYFGDDILDLKCMKPIQKAGGIVGCPNDAIQEVKLETDYLCLNKAGDGALREFVEWLVNDENSDRKMEILNNRINYAIKYLRGLSIADADLGIHHVNDTFFYSVQKYQTREEVECVLESHKQYVDIQLMVQGCELMKVVDTSRLEIQKQYDTDNDLILWELPQRMMSVVLSEGDYIILHPENAHMGCIKLREPIEVLKIVGKVKVH